MTDQTILNQLLKLKVTFPNHYKHYGKEENVALAKIWQKQFASVEDSDMIQVVDAFISNNSFPPSIKELKDALKNLEVERMVNRKPVPWQVVEPANNIYK